MRLVYLCMWRNASTNPKTGKAEPPQACLKAGCRGEWPDRIPQVARKCELFLYDGARCEVEPLLKVVS